MKLNQRLPCGVTVRGRFYRMDFDFRNVFSMLDVLARDDLLPEAREYLALKCVMRRPRGDISAILRAARLLLFGEQEKQKSERITDFAQDADLIRAAFMQVYHINLYREPLHWLEFTALLSGLPKGTRYRDVLGIRARPMPAPTEWNAEERRLLAEAKAEYALQIPEQEQQETLNAGLRGIAMTLLAMAEKGSEQNA